MDNIHLIQGKIHEITGYWTLPAPTLEIIEEYAETLHLYRTTPVSARKIAVQTGVSIKGFYKYLQTWHKDLICEGEDFSYEKSKLVDVRTEI